jgi:hypothetical protein
MNESNLHVSAICGDVESSCKLPMLWKLYLSEGYIFASYDEQSFFVSWANELGNNIISVFSCDRRLEFRLDELCDKDRDADELYEIDAAYTYANHIVFIGYDSHFVWNLDAPQRTWKKVPFPFSMVGIRVLTGTTRPLTRSSITEGCLVTTLLLPFELAVFDLPTAAKRDFAPVEAALTAAGFAMSETNFQLNSTGQIIVSDGKQAALLEFSEP